MKMNYCPQCATTLVSKVMDQKERLYCPDHTCGYVFWNNPVPVVLAIVELPGGIVLAHNKQWPKGIYSMIAGFLESNESPEAGARREVAEELGVACTSTVFLGVFPFPAMNQLLLVYHLQAEGTIVLNEELDDFKVVSKEELKGWELNGRFGVEEWLKNKSVLR